MQKKKVELQLTANPQKTPQQIQFESQWKEQETKPVEAPPAQFVPRYQPVSSQPSIEVTDEKFDKDEDFEDAAVEKNKSFDGQFGHGSSQNFKPFKSFQRFESFDQDASIYHFESPMITNYSSLSGGIPGLDIPQECEELPSETIELDEEVEQDYFPEDTISKLDVPPMPSFKKHNRTVIDILDILENSVQSSSK